MSTVTVALFQREYRAIQKTLRKESDLRKSLTQLDAQTVNAKSQGDQYCAMKAIGADFLWLAWVSKTRRQLNTELAQVIVQKMEAMIQIRKAFGQNGAVENLLSADRQKQKQKTARQQAERLTSYL